jgi:hypothetical protein
VALHHFLYVMLKFFVSKKDADTTMRTTVNLSTAALATARRYAAARSVNLGQAVSDLIEQAASQRLAMRTVNGVWVADLPPDAKRITDADVADLLANE